MCIKLYCHKVHVRTNGGDCCEAKEDRVVIVPSEAVYLISVIYFATCGCGSAIKIQPHLGLCLIQRAVNLSANCGGVFSYDKPIINPHICLIM